jgi:hypothetical protein
MVVFLEHIHLVNILLLYYYIFIMTYNFCSYICMND